MPVPTDTFTLLDRYERTEGRIYVGGVPALVRAPLDRIRLDRRRELRTAALISGYEGSPLAGYDLELARHKDLLDEHDVRHQPALNEELAATAVAGTQLAATVADLRHDGVTGYWYGKAPGLDRATDALRHANLIGTAGSGGAVAFVGDDPAAKSSSVPCSSEFALADLMIPTLSPADAGEILAFSLHAVELSRASGLWSALRISTTVADGATTADVRADWTAPTLAGLDGAYAHRPTARLLGAELAALEQSLHLRRWPLALEYLRRSDLNRIEGAAHGARVGLVAAGSTYLFLRQALARLGIDDPASRGIRILKLGAVHPLDPSVVARFADGLQDVIVVEDKRPFLEDAIKAQLYGTSTAPRIRGRRGVDGTVLMPPTGELDTDAIAPPLRRELEQLGVGDLAPLPAPRSRTALSLVGRPPFFCSGCPHNSSTPVADGTLVGAGIGCHAMVLLMPGKDAVGLTQMGGEGAQWLGMAPFVRQRHFVQNIGDGTFAHSGSLAVRAAVASGANVTFKLLRNATVAMTGGQDPVGELSLRQVIRLLSAEGVARIVVTSDDPEAARRQAGRGVEVRHRRDLLSVQEELAAVPGVTVLIHDQECAAEKRRKRKRGTRPAASKRVAINQRICEGCGDCGVASNCLSVQPVRTEYGRKTTINQASCNLDFSCLQGDCPSFVTVTPAANRPRPLPVVDDLPEPEQRDGGHGGHRSGFTMRITGIGGTGVVTLTQILATAAAMEGRPVRTLDQTGLAQKGGAVVSDLRFDDAARLRSPSSRAGSAICTSAATRWSPATPRISP